jgi:hypothetical protein
MVEKGLNFDMIPIIDHRFIDEERPTSYSPAIPIRVHIGDLIIERHALIDTGASISLINKDLLGDLQGMESVKIMGIGGIIQTSYYILEVEILSPKNNITYPLGPIKFMAMELPKGYDIILGQDGVLNRFKYLTIDYPNRKFSIELKEEQVMKKEEMFLTEAKSLINQGNYSAGITLIGMYIEEIINKLGKKHGIIIEERKTKTSVLKCIEQLNRKKIISSFDYNIISSLWNTRNKVVHQGYKITNKDAFKALEFTEKITKLLNKSD